MQRKLSVIRGFKCGARLKRRGWSLVHFSKECRFLAVRVGSGPVPVHLSDKVGDARTTFEACEVYLGGAIIELRLHIVEINIFASILAASYPPQVQLRLKQADHERGPGTL